MAALVPSLVKLRSEFDLLFPGRDRTTDGWIGDPAHQARDSDHNRDPRGLVHAIDVDAGLGPTANMQAFVDFLVKRCKAGDEKRLKYVIYNRRIWSASWGWTRRSYGGTNPHTEHAHFSASYTPAHEQDVAAWRLEEVPVALTDADKKWLEQTIDRAVEARVGDVVPRWTAEGTTVPAGDPNPAMTSANALSYIGRAVARIEKAVGS